MFEQVSEETLREILCIMHSVTATTHETVKRRPIDLAKLRQCGPGDVGFGVASPGREHDTPVSRRKQIAGTAPVLHASIHVNVRNKMADDKLTTKKI